MNTETGGENAADTADILIEDLPELLPRSCPHCFMPRDQLIFVVGAVIPGELSYDVRGGAFDFLQVQPPHEAPLCAYVYGWYCPGCGEDEEMHEFEDPRTYKVSGRREG